MTKKDKLNRLAKAANNLRTAAEAMRQIMEDKGDNYYITEDARYYFNQIQELISYDNGEAGLDALIRIVNREVNA